MNKNGKIVVAVSGGGRSLANLITYSQQHESFEVVGVITSDSGCRAVEIAKENNISVYSNRFEVVQNSLPDFIDDLYNFVEQKNAQFIVLAGFIRMFPVKRSWQKRIINIHPALLPKFGGQGMYGIRVHKAVIAAKALTTGASVHFVNDRYDEGALISQIKISVSPQDDEHSIATKVFAAECILYPKTIEALVKGDLPLPGGHVKQFTLDCK